MDSEASASSYQSLEQDLFGFEIVDAAAPEETATGSSSSLATEAATPAVSAAALEVTALPETGRLHYFSAWKVPAGGHIFTAVWYTRWSVLVRLLRGGKLIGNVFS